jgi:hypothetical protein
VFRWPRIAAEPALLADLWQSRHETDLVGRAELIHRLRNELELLDVDDLVSFLERETPPARDSVVRIAEFVHTMSGPQR